MTASQDPVLAYCREHRGSRPSGSQGEPYELQGCQVGLIRADMALTCGGRYWD
jgi:hypothetical protein